ncbi:MAG: ADP-glyceromanno-heptose 6-epimerase [bacterium]
MIVVTGGLGFIGYNIILELNKKFTDEIIIVENIKNTISLDIKLKRLKNIKFLDLLDRSEIKNWEDFIKSRKVECVIHQGASTNTLEKNFSYLWENNYVYTKNLIDACINTNTKLIYASSASVYGNKNYKVTEEENMDPLNYYAYSKFLIDNYFLKLSSISKKKSRIVGLRYFNVYGPYEENKNEMSSVVFKFYNQLKKEGVLYLFEGSENFKRDFIFVEDIVKINIFFMQNEYSGIYNCGTGVSESFFKIAEKVIEKIGYGKIEFIPFPENLKNQYQKFTQADNTKLKTVFKEDFTTLEEGVSKYIEYLMKR